ncbi:inverse autotransporter beta domain-containing protein [thiotrophic endosymbiont of Bathymodiolus puteoserpentis (Logatchev)]|uniref:inverse autotransporter beta domain-containing protein n=1 Tax=thiotrophic endosymbiont of Bathymodiolus puteoserpentis (Logatchev) TaxID=343240 RepID=UPI00315A2D9D
MGKKVATDIKNQAINKTEGFVNNKANTFLNAFGAGRSEVSIGGLSSKKLNYSLRTIQPISELDANSKALTFIQASIASGKSIDSRRTTVNLGVGHRLLVENDMAIAGINVFTDYESKSKHKRLSLGLEYQRANFSANINKYHVFSDEKLVNSIKERGRSGYDVKLSGQAPYLPWAKIKGTYYYWDTKTGPDIKGNILGVDIEITPSVSFELGQENNNTMDAKSYGKLTVKLPLGNKQKFTNFAIASKAFKDSRKMDLGALAWVERSNKIMIERGEGGISFKGLTYKLVTSPDTGRVWLDRNLGAIQVATKKDDSAAYGDHYPFSDISGNNDICPAGFGVPTEGELAAETIVPTPISTPTTALSSFLKLPAAGGGQTSDNLAGDVVFLWTKTTVSGEGRYLTIASSNREFSTSITSGFKFSVRCIKTRTPIVFNGLTYKMITSSKTGKVWLDRNLGATQVATSLNDSDAYGDLYQWGRAKDGHEKSSTTTKTIATSLDPANNGAFILADAQPDDDWVVGNVDNDGALRTVAWADGGVNDICPAGFSVPTKAELKEDIIDAGITSADAALSSPLKLPAAGYRDRAIYPADPAKNGKVHDIGTSVFLWSRSADGSKASYLSINSAVDSGNLDRSYGFSVRCIQAQGVTVFADPAADSSRFYLLLTGGIGDKVGSISTRIIEIKEKYEGVAANKISIRNAVNAVKTGTHYRFVSGVSKEDAKNIIASLVLRAPNIIIETIKIPPIPPSRPAISFKGLTYEQVVSPNTKKIWLDRNIGAANVGGYGSYLNYASANNNGTCPMGFGLPTKAELEVETAGAVNKVTNLETALKSFLRIPAAGNNIKGAGKEAFLWTATEGSNGSDTYPYALHIEPNNAQFRLSRRVAGYSVRCVKD